MLRRQSLSIGLAMDFPVNLTAIFQGSSYACRTKNLRKKALGIATLSCANRCKDAECSLQRLLWYGQTRRTEISEPGAQDA
jgi:hypothetical protein